jgi:uncharacterized membrane protein YeaQ/YmgE (transglycosylase-associated protein family)
LNATLCASIGCFTGLVLTLMMRPTGVWGAAVDALLGAVGGLLAAWFIAPISENANNPDALNIAAIVAAIGGSFVLVAVSKLVPRK